MLTNYFGEVKIGDLITGVDGPVTRRDIIRYAEVSGDRNPIHTTYEVAMATGLKGVIQHGLFSLGWLIKTLMNWVQDKGKLEHIRIQFRAMVRPNDIIYSYGRIIKKYKKDQKNCVDLELYQEAQSLLCKGVVQAEDKTLTQQAIEQLLSKVRIGLEIQADIEDGRLKNSGPNKMTFEADGFHVDYQFLSFWEGFTRGWFQQGDEIRIKLPAPPINGKALVEMYKVSRSIQGVATISLTS